MVICQYFQQGNCRFGSSCRNDHIYASRYNYQAPRVAAQPQSRVVTQPQTRVVTQPQTNKHAEVTIEQLLSQVKLDTEAALRGHQWLLTVYAPFKEKANMPGFTDQSFEEIRLLMYEAQKNNTLPQTINIIQQKIEEAQRKYQNLLQPNALIAKTLQSIYKGEIPNNPYETVDINNEPSVFAAAVAGLSPTKAQPISNQSNSILSNQNTIPQSSSIFASANAQQPSSLFGNANKQYENGLFPTAQAAVQPSDIFKNQVQSVFGNQNVSSGPSTELGKAPTSTDPASLFSNASKTIFSKEIQQNPANVFAQSNSQLPGNDSQSPFAKSPFSNPGKLQGSGFPRSVTSVVQIDAYSLEEAISQEDMTEFLSDTFRLGFIPELAPPKSVC